MMEADNDQQKKLQKKQEIERTIEKVFKEILEKYKLMIDQIRYYKINKIN
jgi:hypothetical protein